jgi:putative ABC transport system permease protein
MNMRKLPPALFHRFFRWFCKPDLRSYVEGDLLELYEERLRTRGKAGADIQFCIDVILLFRPGIISLSQESPTLKHHVMLSNYFKIGFRNVMKYKTFSIINIFGLALAMSVSMLIILMLIDQRTYDQFHSKKERIYRIVSADRYATSPFPLANALKHDYPIIEESTHLTPGVAGDALYNQELADMRGYFTDPSFFRIFSFELAQGDPSRALTEPRSMVITKEIARLLFHDEDPLGKTIDFYDRKLAFPQEFEGVSAPPVSWGSFTVTGVIDEKLYRSHLKFDVLVSASTMPVLYSDNKINDDTNNWESYSRTYTFVLLQPEKSIDDLNASLKDLLVKKYKDIHFENVKEFHMVAQPLKDIQFAINGNDTGVRLPGLVYYFLGGLALIIMFSACLNYTNLSIARAITRAKEIGIRKVTGANRTALILQFLCESVLTAFFSLGVALILLIIIRPAFMSLWINRYLKFELPDNPQAYVIFVVFTLVIGLIAGIYPALRISSYTPVKAIKALTEVRTGKMRLYKVLNISQFVISLFFITTSILIFNQFRHFINFNYGFNARNILNVELQGVKYSQLANELQSVPGVTTVSGSDLIPATGTNNGNSFRKPGQSDNDYKFLSILNVDEHYVNNLDLKIIAGRNLPAARDSADNRILVNETAVEMLGYKSPGEIVGTVIESKWGSEQLEVIGVVRNFRYKLLLNDDDIQGLILRNQPVFFQYANVKIESSDVMATVANIESKWKQIDPIHPIKYKFFEDDLAGSHQAIFDVVAILGSIAFLSIVISCLGLLGMATYTAERKKKEVGIRKVLGAESAGIALLLSRSFVNVLFIAVIIGAPLSYFLNNLWLQKLPNRVDFGAGTILLATSLLLVLGLIVIGSQTLRASRTNPVESLQSE